MNLSPIKEGSIIIAPSYLHHFIRKQLLVNKKGIGNIQLYSFSTWLAIPHEVPYFTYYSTLREIANTLDYNKKSVVTNSFMEEIYHLINHLKEYQIDPITLKEDNPFQIELKRIVQLLYPIEIPIDSLHKNFDRVPQDCSSVYIIDEYCNDFQNSIYTLLEKRQAKRIHYQQEQPYKTYYYALNKRQEIESLAQYIVQNKIDVNDSKLSLLDKSYLPYIKLIFKRYHIPYHIVKEQEISLIHTKFITLLNYYLNPTSENAIALLQKQVLIHKDCEKCIEYLTLYELDFHQSFNIVSDIHLSDRIISIKELTQLKQLEAKAMTVKEAFLPLLNKITTQTDIMSVLNAIDSYLCEHHMFTNEQDRNALQQIRGEIKRNASYLKDQDSLNLLIARIKKQNVSISSPYKGMMVNDFSHPLPNCEYHFVVGCTQSNFPAFKPLQGIFDESYYQTIEFPSLTKRYELHRKQYEAYLNTSSYLVCFYPISTFDGKANESSLELDAYMECHAKRYPLQQVSIAYQREYQIAKTDAEKLYVNEGCIHGSVSSFERYAKCPYSYFLRYGLNIKEPMDYTFNSAKAGSLSHYLMETLLSRYGKEYIHTSKEELNTILTYVIDDITHVYPNQTLFLKQMEERLLISMSKNLEILKDHEMHSFFTSFRCEDTFEHAIEAEAITIKLKGMIDRIDMNHDFFRIIDYKSSHHVLKENDVFSGLQLQLVTYLVLMQKKLNKRALGAFYYSFANPNINMIHTKLSKRPLGFQTYTKEEGFHYLLKEKKLDGWISDESIEVMDTTGTHIRGVRNTKTKGITARTIYDIDTLAKYVEELYVSLANDIVAGRIECKSVHNACLYCPYAQVCANANHSYTREERIEVSPSLYHKGGRKYD